MRACVQWCDAKTAYTPLLLLLLRRSAIIVATVQQAVSHLFLCGLTKNSVDALSQSRRDGRHSPTARTNGSPRRPTDCQRQILRRPGSASVLIGARVFSEPNIWLFTAVLLFYYFVIGYVRKLTFTEPVVGKLHTESIYYHVVSFICVIELFRARAIQF